MKLLHSDSDLNLREVLACRLDVPQYRTLDYTYKATFFIYWFTDLTLKKNRSVGRKNILKNTPAKYILSSKLLTSTGKTRLISILIVTTIT